MSNRNDEVPARMGPFHGIIPPVCTPLTEDHEVDIASLERLLGFLLDAGVHGVFMLGSTSETALLSDCQRETVLDVAVRTVAGHVPVLAGIIDLGTAQTLGHAQVAHRLGVDGLVATAPFYVRPSQEEIIVHFRAIRQTVDLPLFAYDVPPNVQTKIERPTIATMAHDGLIAGLKDSSGDDANFRGVLLDTHDLAGFATFTGSELMVDVALFIGAAGAVPGLGNVDPAGYVRIYDAVRAGDLDAARREQERLFRLFSIIDAAVSAQTGRTASALGSFKTALILRGVIATNIVGRPMTRLNHDAVMQIRAALERAGLI